MEGLRKGGGRAVVLHNLKHQASSSSAAKLWVAVRPGLHGCSTQPTYFLALGSERAFGLRTRAGSCSQPQLLPKAGAATLSIAAGTGQVFF